MTDPAVPFRRVSILGVGLLGGSIGLALRRAGFTGRLVGYGHRQSSLDAAVAAGCIDAGTLDLAEAVAGADLVVLCSPVGLFEGLFRELGSIWRSGTRHRVSAENAPGRHEAPTPVADTRSPNPIIVTDVGSTKKQVVAWAGKLLPEGVAFVGSHPIAGSDKRGSQYARADLFDGACCVVTPGKNANSQYALAVQSVESLWRTLGMWTVRMTPAGHDRALAQVSHLPHATAAALVLLSSPAAQDLSGGGFLDSTRIAGGDPALWRDIFLTNAAEVVKSIKAMNRKLDRLADLIAAGNGPGLVRFLSDAQQRRQELMGRKLKRRQIEG